MVSAPTAYDEVPYTGQPFRQTHPDHLATMATLFGMAPPALERCRVLELGCGDGNNLVPMAYSIPGAEFVGIDLAARAISQGQAMIDSLGLRNIVLRCSDILKTASDLGQFDYIIAHGIYSWVPFDVRDRLLAVCRENLSPTGVAFISYNAYPGGHLRDMLREMMLFHVREWEKPADRAAQGKALITWIAESHPEDDLYRLLLERELQTFEGLSDEYIHHDQLALVNEPVYFYRFVEHAEKHGLQFLSEASLFEMDARLVPASVASMLRAMPDEQIVIKEQYLDFIRCRKFRNTLLCRKEAALSRTIAPERLRSFYVAGSPRLVSGDKDLKSQNPCEFQGEDDKLKTGIIVETPIGKAALQYLSEIWPRAMKFDELMQEARSATGDTSAASHSEADATALGTLLLEAFRAGIINLHLYVPSFVTEVSERPVASPVARLQIQRTNKVANLYHTRVQIFDSLLRFLLPLLDGSRDRAALIGEVSRLVESGAINLQQHGEPVRDQERIRTLLGNVVEEELQKIARLALLVV